MRKLVTIALFLALQCFASIAKAGGVDATSELYNIIESLKSVSADFDQRIVDRDGIVIQESKGHFKLARPNKIYWKTQPPYEQEIIGDGTTLWVYDPDLEQVTQYDDGALLQGPMALFSESLDDINTRFDVSLETRETNGALSQRYSLAPKLQTVEEGFSKLVFEFRDSNLGKIEIHDKLRQVTTISLRDVTNNSEIPDQNFKFVPPAGIDVLLSE